MRELTNPFTRASLPPIPSDETVYHPHSFADTEGRVFLWDGQLYRGIFPRAAPFFRKVAESGIISNLVEQRLLVQTELTEFTSNEFPLVFHHRRVPFVSYPQEWCQLMFKDAALAVLDLAIALAHDEMVLTDGHPWNILFDACEPVFIDLGSIAPEDGSSVWSAYPDFCRYCLYPLILMSQGYDLMGRLLMCEDRGVSESELLRLAPKHAVRAHIHWHVNLGLAYAEKYLTYLKNRLLQKTSITRTSKARQASRDQKKLLSFLKQLRQLVESIPVGTNDPQAELKESPVKSAQEYDEARALNGEVIHRLLTELHPDSLLDLNSGNGSIARQAAGLGARVVCFDTDHGDVSRLYRQAKTKGLSILPLVMDFTKPTPARGLGSHWAIAATERLQCDLVLALDLMSAPTARRLGWDKIIGSLGQFSRRWLVLEIPCDARDNQSKRFSMESCNRLLAKQFRTITQLDSSAHGSSLLLCEKS